MNLVGSNPKIKGVEFLSKALIGLNKLNVLDLNLEKFFINGFLYFIYFLIF